MASSTKLAFVELERMLSGDISYILALQIIHACRHHQAILAIHCGSHGILGHLIAVVRWLVSMRPSPLIGAQCL